MMRSLCFFILVVLGLTLGACTRFVYPNGNQQFTVLASADNPKQSDRDAMSKARVTCDKYDAYVQVLRMRRVKNGFDRVVYTRQGTYVTYPKKEKDYMSIVNFICKKRLVQKKIYHKKTYHKKTYPKKVYHK